MTTDNTEPTLSQKLIAEALGTAFLLMAIVGSGILAVNLADGNDAVALLANAGCVGAILFVLIIIFGPVSGAHFNPAVTLAFWLQKEIDTPTAIKYVLTQILAALIGVVVTHVMFEMSLVQLPEQARNGYGQYLGELIATFGLLMTIFGCVTYRSETVPAAVGLYITSAIWFTSSTCFANPAVTIARAITDTFVGIRPIDAPAFVLLQLAAAAFAALIAKQVFPSGAEEEASEPSLSSQQKTLDAAE
ncbi:MAG: MIP/aquaporin family protein [Pseudomonadota bacterium]